MSRFGKHGVRCDGCGIIAAGRDGSYKRDGKYGTICSWGRNCAHDFCRDCEAMAPPDTCRKCGELTATVENEPLQPRRRT